MSYEAGLPIRGMLDITVSLPGQDSATADRRNTLVNFVGPDFLRANGTPLRRGRDITDQDRAGTLRVAVVNETMAKRLWPNADPIGQCMIVSVGPRGGSATLHDIVGVMADGKYLRITEDPKAFDPLPNAQQRLNVGPHGAGPPLTLVVRGSGDPHRLIPTCVARWKRWCRICLRWMSSPWPTSWIP